MTTDDRQNQRIRTVARQVSEHLGEIRVHITGIQMELTRLAEVFTIPPGSAGDADGQAVDVDYYWVQTPNGRIHGAQTIRGLGHIAETLLRGPDHQHGLHVIHHRAREWGGLAIHPGHWIITGPGDYRDERTANWNDLPIPDVPAKGPEEPGPPSTDWAEDDDRGGTAWT